MLKKLFSAIAARFYAPATNDQPVGPRAGFEELHAFLTRPEPRN